MAGGVEQGPSVQGKLPQGEVQPVIGGFGTERSKVAPTPVLRRQAEQAGSPREVAAVRRRVPEVQARVANTQVTFPETGITLRPGEEVVVGVGENGELTIRPHIVEPPAESSSFVQKPPKAEGEPGAESEIPQRTLEVRDEEFGLIVVRDKKGVQRGFYGDSGNMRRVAVLIAQNPGKFVSRAELDAVMGESFAAQQKGMVVATLVRRVNDIAGREALSVQFNKSVNRQEGVVNNDVPFTERELAQQRRESATEEVVGPPAETQQSPDITAIMRRLEQYRPGPDRDVKDRIAWSAMMAHLQGGQSMSDAGGEPVEESSDKGPIQAAVEKVYDAIASGEIAHGESLSAPVMDKVSGHYLGVDGIAAVKGRLFGYGFLKPKEGGGYTVDATYITQPQENET